ncbi:MAG: hypothetical protein QM811_10970 [Pirellulales bacterium]
MFASPQPAAQQPQSSAQQPHIGSAQQALFQPSAAPAALPANWGQKPLEIDSPSAQTAVFYGAAPQTAAPGVAARPMTTQR